LPELVNHEGFAAIDMAQEFSREGADGADIRLKTTRAPVRFDGAPLGSPRGAPRVGEHTKLIDAEFRGEKSD